MCHKNPTSPLRHAANAGATSEELMDIAIDIAWDGPGVKAKPNEECPI